MRLATGLPTLKIPSPQVKVIKPPARNQTNGMSEPTQPFNQDHSLKLFILHELKSHIKRPQDTFQRGTGSNLTPKYFYFFTPIDLSIERDLL